MDVLLFVFVRNVSANRGKRATKNNRNKGEYTMKITPELKEKLEAAKTAEEKKKLLTEAGVKLTDEEIEKVAGGIVVEDWENGGLFE